MLLQQFYIKQVAHAEIIWDKGVETMGMKLILLAFVFIVGIAAIKMVKKVSPNNKWFTIYTLTILTLTTVYFFNTN